MNAKFYEWLKINGHNGIDYSAIYGEPVFASHDGEVIFVGQDAPAGNHVILRTLEPREWAGSPCYFKTVYLHLKAPACVLGQQIKTGDVLGFAGNTGWVNPVPTPQKPHDGTHLHFGVKAVMPGESDSAWTNVLQNNGYAGAIDPMPYMNGFAAEGAQETIANQKAQVSLLQQVVNLLKRLVG